MNRDLCLYTSNAGLAPGPQSAADFEVGAGSTVTRSRQTEPLSFRELPTWAEGSDLLCEHVPDRGVNIRGYTDAPITTIPDMRQTVVISTCHNRARSAVNNGGLRPLLRLRLARGCR